jgi:MoaA/NifB/PqqE/SkfB family radical SAM enzyme
MKKSDSTFCVIPFTSITTSPNNHWRQCCDSPPLIEYDGQYFSIFEYNIEDMWNHDFYKKLRMDLITGVKNPACNKCWKKEEVGAFSYRKKANNNSKLIDEETIEQVYNNNGHLDLHPKYIVLKIGNLCNLKCIMCNQVSSDKIEKEIVVWKSKQEQLPQWLNYIDQYDVPDEIKDVRSLSLKSTPEKVIAQLEPALSQCYELELVGGEAFVNPFTNDLLEYCITKGIAKNISIQTISNLSLINKKQVELMKQFKSVDLTASFDHIDVEQFYFIRYPASYTDFRKNFDSLVNSDVINLKISTTFSIFNIFDIDRIFDEFETISQSLSKPLTINFNLVLEPNYFDIKYLEETQKAELTNKISAYIEKNKHYKIFCENPSTLGYVETIPNYLKQIPNDFDTVVKERTRVLELYDRTRNTNYKQLYPFIKEYQWN